LPQRNGGEVMIFAATPLEGAFVIDIERHHDSRGFFARSFCQEEFRKMGLNPLLAQCNISFNEKVGTFRGMHYQVPPHAEAKLVRCTRGSLYDIIVDLRPGSPTFRKHFGVTLTDKNRRMLYIPELFAHGFITTQEETEIFYQMSEFYTPESARGFRWNDPYFDIRLPVEVSVISDRDRTYPDFAASI
jgi:dTDP-4-dehydrorhamnose 3,5-epimerase